MEPQSTRLRAATTWAGGAAALHERAALQFAERRQYRDLLHAVQLRPELSSKSDAFAMTPLHWLCTDRAVPLRVLQQIVLAYPTATTMRNLAGLLPIHMAVRKDLPLDALKTVLKFYPKAIVAETPDGKTPLQLAQEHITSRSAKQFLAQLEQEVRSLGRVPASQSSTVTTASSNTSQDSESRADTLSAKIKRADTIRGWDDGYPVRIIDATSSPSSSQHSIEEHSPEPAVETRPLPPVWKLNNCCHICDSKFGYFKTRHHCRNCGESVCGRHSKNAVPLKHLGLFHPQRVCSRCFGRLQAHYTNRALAKVNLQNNPSDHQEDIVFEDTLPNEYAYSPPRQRQTRSYSAHAMTPTQTTAFQQPLISPGHYVMRTPSPVLPTPPPAVRSPRSPAPSSQLQRTASLTTTGRSVASTATKQAYQPNFIKIPSGMSMHITHVQRTDDQLTVLERQQDMQRRRDRLANTDIDLRTTPPEWRDRESETLDRGGNQCSNDDHEIQLEMQMQQLLIAKKQISDALTRSKAAVSEAKAEKTKYEGLAKEFERRGYAYPSGSSQESGRALASSLSQESGIEIDESTSFSSSCAAAKYGYLPSEDNQRCHKDIETLSDTQAKFDVTTAVESDVYALVPDTTPGEVLQSGSSPFEKDSLDMPLNLASTYHDLGVVMLSKGDFASAAVELQKSLDLDQSNAQTWYHFAKALDGKGERQLAESAIQSSLSIEPNSLRSLSLLGKLLNARGEHDEAISVFRRALNLQCPSDASPARAF